MGIDLLIGFIATYILIAIWKGGEAVNRKLKYFGVRETPPSEKIVVLEQRLDNRGYSPFDGMVLFKKGVYSTIIFRNEDIWKTEYLNAPSFEELQKICDPILIERREAWLKRKAAKKKRKQQR